VMYGRVETWLHAFLTVVLGGNEWSVSRFGRLTATERVPSTHWMGVGTGTKACMDVVGKKKSLPLPGVKSRSSSP